MAAAYADSSLPSPGRHLGRPGLTWARTMTTGAAPPVPGVRPPGTGAGQEARRRIVRVPRSWMLREELPTSTLTRPAGVTQLSAWLSQ